MNRRIRLQIGLAAGVVVAAALLPVGCGRYMPPDPEPNMKAALTIREGFMVASSKKSAAAGAGEKSAAAEKKFDGWATLKGRFVLDGAAPPAEAINVTKDQLVCGVHPLFNEAIAINDKDKGIANIVVFVHTSKLPVHPDYAKSAGDKVELNNKDCRFAPHVLGIRVGQTLLVKNSDPVGHNTKIDGINLQFNKTIPSDSSMDQSIDSAENLPVPVSCGIHPWMSAKLLVRPDPYFAISDASGRFEIKNVPAGDLEFQVWQETANYLHLDRPDLKWDDKGRFQVSLHNGEVKDLQDVAVPAAALKPQ